MLTARLPLLMQLAVLAAFLLALPASAEETKPVVKPAETLLDVKVVADIDYYTGTDADKVKHKLDLYLPKDQKDFPVLFFVHGGGWSTGDKNFFGVYSSLGKFYARRGIGTVVTNYRLSPKVQHPEHIKDVARAFAWTVRNISKYGGRPDALFVSGHSAGGHLVALLATDESYLEGEKLTSAAIRGVIPISGVYSTEGVFLNSIFGKDAEKRKQASPIMHVRKGLPSFLILYADRDYAICGRGPSERFCKALQGKDCKAATREIKDSSHLKIILSAARTGDVVIDTIVEFVTSQSAKR